MSRMLIDSNVRGSLPDAREQTWLIDHDVITYGSTESLTNKKFFDVKRRAAYQSQVWPPQKGRKYYWRYLQVTHNIQIGTYSATIQQGFENFSAIEIKLGDTTYPRIPINVLLPYSIAQQGTSLLLKDNLNSWFKLPEPILVEESSTPEVLFIPQEGLTTSASAPALPWSGAVPAANDTGWWIRLCAYGVLDRPARAR